MVSPSQRQDHNPTAPPALQPSYILICGQNEVRFLIMFGRGVDDPALWAGKVGNSWRTTRDINDSWARFEPYPSSFAEYLRNKLRIETLHLNMNLY